MNPVNHVMLIDDSDDDNYIHQRVITRAGFAEKVTVFNYAHQALEFLRVTPNSVVDIIFLDINMPRMDGFEFLVAYAQLPTAQRAAKLYFMLSANLMGQDQKRADASPHVDGFIGKPLTAAALAEVLRSDDA